MLSRRDPGGWWVRDGHPNHPKYVSTNWNLLALSDLGATRVIPHVRASCEYWMKKSPLEGGGVGGMSNGHGHHCYTGNMARALIKLGYEDDPRVRPALDWLVKTGTGFTFVPGHGDVGTRIHLQPAEHRGDGCADAPDERVLHRAVREVSRGAHVGVESHGSVRSVADRQRV